MREKKLLAILCMGALYFALLSACGGTASVPTAVPSPSPSESEAEETPDPKLDNIAVSMKADTELSQAIITVENNGDETFTGDIPVYIRDRNKKQIGYDILFVEDLTAGNFTYARIDTSSKNIDSFTYEFSSGYTFTEGAPSSGGSLDSDASAKLTEAFTNFSSTSWYPALVKIEVFTSDGGNYVVATVSGADETAIDRIGNALFGNYYKTYSLSKVIVVDENGDTVFTREK